MIFLVASIAGSVWYWRQHRYDQRASIVPPAPGTERAYFAGGCFWCTEADFEKLDGVREAISGYAGGTTFDPTYESVGTQRTGHLETVEVRYDPKHVSYQALVQYFFSHVDPTDGGGQFVDRGDSYRPAVFSRNAEEKRVVEEEIRRLEKSGIYGKPFSTELRVFERFYPAEEYHQDYWKKNPVRYIFYRSNSGRDQYLKDICSLRRQAEIPCLATPE